MGIEDFNQVLPGRIEKSDIEVVPINVDETEIILQRHGRYERNVDDANVGSMTEEGAQEVYDSSTRYETSR